MGSVVFGKASHVDSLRGAWGAFADHHAWNTFTAARAPCVMRGSGRLSKGPATVTWLPAPIVPFKQMIT
jgi:hypothetical protein